LIFTDSKSETFWCNIWSINMSNLNLNLGSFHDYDIRGIYPTEVNEDFYYNLGKSLATYIGKGPIAVGRDCRESSPALAKALIEGITDYGIDVVDLGLISTEMHNFVSGKYDYAANIIVSASHNPPEYNGAKILTKGVIALHGNFGLPEIKAFMNQDLPKAVTKGSISERSVIDDFIQNCLSHVDTSKFKKLKVVVDAANAMGGPVWQRMIDVLPIEIVPLYLDLNGKFPNHIPDPLKDENIVDLRNKVLETGADMGIALDGDADRIFFMDETGARMTGTVVNALFIENFIKHGQNGTFIYNVNIGRIVPEVIKKHGGTPYRIRVGHSFIKEKMKELNAVFGGEHSCHFFFRDNFGAESSLLAGLMMIQILSESGKKLSELRLEHDIYPQSGEINFKVTDGQKVLDSLKEKFAQELTSTDEIDGVTFWFKDFWFIVRFSKTEPVMRLNMETDNKEIMDQRLAEVIEVILSNGGERK
jgi:phosphomannomutase